MQRWLWPSFFVLALSAGFFGYRLMQPVVDSGHSNLSQVNLLASDLVTIPDLTLESVEGPYPLLKPDGQLRILYFGYTQCPDVCPTSLAVLAAALHKLDPELVNQLEPLFITIDPSRDDKAKMAEFSSYFHDDIIGLTGDKQSIDLLAAQLGVIYNYVKLPNSSMEYSVDHSSYFYLISDDGTLLKRIPHTYSPAPIIEAITHILRN